MEEKSPDQVLRIEHNANYKTLASFGVNDSRLSWKAKGVLWYLLSRPDGWKFWVGAVLRQSPDGETALNTAFKELRALGYLDLVPRRSADGKKRGYIWTIREALPEHGAPSLKTQPGKPSLGNQALSSKDSSNKDCSKETIGADFVRQVFAYWQTQLGYQGHKLVDARRKKIVARLKEGYTVDQLKAVVDYAKSDDFLQGKNDRGRKYDDILNIYRNGARVDQYLTQLKRRAITNPGIAKEGAPIQGRIL